MINLVQLLAQCRTSRISQQLAAPLFTEKTQAGEKLPQGNLNIQGY